MNCRSFLLLQWICTLSGLPPLAFAQQPTFVQKKRLLAEKKPHSEHKALPRHTSEKPCFNFSATLRVDVYHVGNHQKEYFILDELKREGVWPSSRIQRVETNDFGSTKAEIFSLKAKPRLTFRHNFSSLFHEWKTTDDAKKRERVFSETVRLPWPREKVKLVISIRGKFGRWKKNFTTVIDPQSVNIDRTASATKRLVHRIHHVGPSPTNLDIVILGDGYQSWQMDKYLQDVKRFSDHLFQTPPFSRYKKRINVWAVESPSRQSGVDEPLKGIYRDTALSMSFNSLGSARYLMTLDNKAVRDVAAHAPYDTIYILSNTSRYGGGGIFNDYASFVSDNAYDLYIFIHEFGHSFAGLADEYYTSSVSYNDMYPRGVEPWEPNITAKKQRRRIKWRDLIDPNTPVPTAENDERYQGKVGLFEGAGYSAKGLYRPAIDCKMFNKGEKPFCPVCARAIAQMIEQYLK